MPRYIYKCECNNEIEVTCKMSEYYPTVKCSCGKEANRKVNDLVSSYQDAQGFYGKKS